MHRFGLMAVLVVPFISLQADSSRDFIVGKEIFPDSEAVMPSEPGDDDYTESCAKKKAKSNNGKTQTQENPPTGTAPTGTDQGPVKAGKEIFPSEE